MPRVLGSFVAAAGVLSLALGAAAGCHLIAGIDEGTAACSVDGERNGLEVAIDCGGPCPKCTDDARCKVDADCASNACYEACPGARCELGKVCQPPNCDDGRRNGEEADIDCGGSDESCIRCFGGDDCNVDGDCGASKELIGGPTCVEHVCRSSCCNEDCGPDCGCPDDNPDCCPGDCKMGGLGQWCDETNGGDDCNEPLTCFYDDDPTEGECY